MRQLVLARSHEIAQAHRPVFSLIYAMCTQTSPHNWSRELYDYHGTLANKYIDEIVLPALKNTSEASVFCELKLQWSNYQCMNEWLRLCFQYLDRYYVKTHGLPTLTQVGLRHFNMAFDEGVKENMKAIIRSLTKNYNYIDRETLDEGLTIVSIVGLIEAMEYNKDVLKLVGDFKSFMHMLLQYEVVDNVLLATSVVDFIEGMKDNQDFLRLLFRDVYSHLVKGFLLLLLRSGVGDIHLKVQGHTFSMDRSILERAGSDLLLYNFCEQYERGDEPIEIPNTTCRAFQHVLLFVHAGVVPDSEEITAVNGKEIIDAADRWVEADGLKNSLETALVRSSVVTAENASEWLNIAEEKNCAILEKHARTFFQFEEP